MGPDNLKPILDDLRKRAEAYLAALYTRRYQDILQALPEKILFDQNGDGTLGTLSDEKREEVVGILRSYVDLCAEEHHLYSIGVISQETWDYWRGGISDNFGKMAALKQVWHKLRIERNYEAFFKALEEGI